MTHDEAIHDGATERYVLDEMTSEERDAFEEHYFDCAVCAEDVKAAIAIRDEGLAAERVAVQPAVIPFEPRRRGLPASLAAAAAAMIAVVSMYALVVQPQKKLLAETLTPAVAEEHLLAVVRDAAVNDIGDHREAAILKIDLETSDRSPRYNFVVFDSAGRQQFSVPVDGERARTKIVSLPIRGGTLKAGSYTLRVDGTEAGVATYRFAVR